MTTTKMIQTFGDVLRELRKQRKVSLGEFARLLEIAPSYLSDIELGRRPPFKLDALERCGQLLSLTETEMRQLGAAAALGRRAFEIPDGAQPRAIDTMAALMRGVERNQLPDAAFEAVDEILARYRQLQEEKK